MKKILKLLIVSFLFVGVIGCSQTTVKLKRAYTLYYFYIPDCSNCNHVSEELIPRIQKTYGSKIKVVKINLDDTSDPTGVKATYDEIINQLEDFDSKYYGYAPFLVLKGKFAQLGVGDDSKLIKNIEYADRGHSLDETDSKADIYYFK